MSQQFTIQQVATHNQTHPNNKYAVIHGDVYRIASIPFRKCPITRAMVETALVQDLNVSELFGSGHRDANTVTVLKSAQGCHVGSIVQAPAGAKQAQQPAQPAQPAQPGHQGHPAQDGHRGRNGHPNNDDDDDDDDDHGASAAERQRLEAARSRRLRRAYDPLRQDPDDAGEYPADAVAMGYLPDLDGRRWRERRMRLSRFIQFNDIPAIDDEDIDRATADALDLDFSKQIRYQKHLVGGRARGCTGSFRAARPPPPRSQLRPRHGGQAPGGQPHAPSPSPPDSDADDDDDDNDDAGDGAPAGPALRARQVQVEGRVRQWFPSNSGIGPTQQATPPVTPHGHTVQQTLRPPMQPPPPAPQHTQQRTPEEEQEIARKKRAEETAAAQKLIRERQRDPDVVKAQLEKLGLLKEQQKSNSKAQRPVEGTQATTTQQESQPYKKAEKSKPPEGKKQPTRKQDEDDRRKRAEDLRKQKEAADNKKRQDAQQRAKKKADDQKRRTLEVSAQRLNELSPEAVRAARQRADEEQREKEAAEKLQNHQDEASRRAAAEAMRVDQNQRRLEVRAEQERQYSPAAIQSQHQQASREAYAAQQARINALMQNGLTQEQARVVVGSQDQLLEDPDQNAQNKKTTTVTTPNTTTKPTSSAKKSATKRPAEPTKGSQGSNKKPRSDKAQPAKKVQSSGGGSSGGGGSGTFDDSNRPYKAGEEPWANKKTTQEAIRLGTDRSDDEDDYESPDELAMAGTTVTGRSSGGSAQPPPAPSPRLSDLPILPSDSPPSATSRFINLRPPVKSSRWPPNLIRPALGGVPKTTTTTTTSTTTSTITTTPRVRGVGIRSSSNVPDDIQKLIRSGRAKGNSSSPSANPSPGPP